MILQLLRIQWLQHRSTCRKIVSISIDMEGQALDDLKSSAANLHLVMDILNLIVEGPPKFMSALFLYGSLVA
ncbi:unnamed protein product [Plutella xylostella]|uniref:(diamondback moth) hypothetical protein n=1 Tax=Plutella xylostella TaxID=51655 RepID=A0A8S4FBP6_PLUXY|nr:unnamed protein product [Plutella xylostella]